MAPGRRKCLPHLRPRAAEENFLPTGGLIHGKLDGKQVNFTPSTEYEFPGRIVRRAQRFGLFANRNLFWYKSPSEPFNFGDWVGPLLYEALTGRKPHWCTTGRVKWRGRTVYSVGSILHMIDRPGRAIVWGSGIIKRDAAIVRPREIRAVRGPISRARCLELGYQCPEIYGDPAILLPKYLPAKAGNPRYRLGVIPHSVNMDEARKRLPQSGEVLLIDVMRPVQDVCRDIGNCAHTVSTSLHGLIVSHAFDIPSAWMGLEAPLYGDGVKFHDYYASAGLPAPDRHHPDPGPLDIDMLVAIARTAPMPELAGLHDGLLQSCPF